MIEAFEWVIHFLKLYITDWKVFVGVTTFIAVPLIVIALVEGSASHYID